MASLNKLPQELLNRIADSIDPGPTIIRRSVVLPQAHLPLNSQLTAWTPPASEIASRQRGIDKDNSQRYGLSSWTRSCKSLYPSGVNALYRNITLSTPETFSAFTNSVRYILERPKSGDSPTYPLTQVKMVTFEGFGDLNNMDELVDVLTLLPDETSALSLLPNAKKMCITDPGFQEAAILIEYDESAVTASNTPPCIDTNASERVQAGLSALLQPTGLCFDRRPYHDDPVFETLADAFITILMHDIDGSRINSVNYHVGSVVPHMPYPCFSGQNFHMSFDRGLIDSARSMEHKNEDKDLIENALEQLQQDMSTMTVEEIEENARRVRDLDTFARQLPLIFHGTVGSLLRLLDSSCLLVPPPPPPPPLNSMLEAQQTLARRRPSSPNLDIDNRMPGHRGCCWTSSPPHLIFSGLRPAEYNLGAQHLLQMTAVPERGSTPSDVLIHRRSYTISFSCEENSCSVCGGH